MHLFLRFMETTGRLFQWFHYIRRTGGKKVPGPEKNSEKQLKAGIPYAMMPVTAISVQKGASP